MMQAVLPYTARQFGRGIIMPNLREPVTTAAEAEKYRLQITEALLEENLSNFTPLMTAYLTDLTEANDIERGFNEGIFAAAKMYPANSTTNSARGVSDIRRLGKVLRKMEDVGMLLLIHGEVTIRVKKDTDQYIGHGADTDIIVASAKAYMNALNRLIALEDISDIKPIKTATKKQ